MERCSRSGDGPTRPGISKKKKNIKYINLPSIFHPGPFGGQTVYCRCAGVGLGFGCGEYTVLDHSGVT